MNSSFTEHVLERAKERQKKLAPRLEANLSGQSSASQPNLLPQSKQDNRIPRKDVVSDPTSTPINTRSPTKTIMSKQNSKTRILSSSSSGSPMIEFNELNIQRNNFNMEIKFSSTDNVRLEVEIEDDDSDSTCSNLSNTHDNTSTSALRDTAKNRLQRLGKLYAGDDGLSSPIHRTEEKFQIEDNNVSNKVKETKLNESKPRKGLGKLADLAKDINQWEDDITPRRDITINKDVVPKKSWKVPAPQPPQIESVSIKPAAKNKPVAPKPPVINNKPENIINKSIMKASAESNQQVPKQLNWDASIINSLESQGFTRTSSNSRLVYNYKNSQDGQENKVNPVTQPIEEEPIKTTAKHIISKKVVPLNLPKEENKVTPRLAKSNAIANKAAVFERNSATAPVKDKDPALLSVSERKALFEINHGNALVPKAAFGMSAPMKTSAKPQTVSSASKLIETPKTTSNLELGGVAAKIAQLNKHQSTISQEQIESKVKEDRQKEMEVLMNRFNHNKTVINKENESESDNEHDITETTAMINVKQPKVVSSSKSPMSPPLPDTEPRRSGEKRTKKGDSPQVKAVLGDIKRIKVTQPKDGELYPCLSDIEAATETETEPTVTSSANNSLLQDSFCNSDDGNTSFGREILEVVCNNQSAQKKEFNDGNSDSDLTDVFEEMDEFLNGCDQDTDDGGPSPPKNIKLLTPQKSTFTKPSDSFNYKSYSPKKLEHSPNQFQSPCKPLISQRRESEEFPIQVMDGTELVPLTYTVSFYRKQQAQPSTTPIRQISRQPAIEEIEGDDNAVAEVAEKIKQLTEDVSKQQMVISQTSRALNLCNSTPEFTGSTEQVEAEKVLLLSTHRRQAATLEIQRLKVEGSLRPIGSHTQNLILEKGSVTISDIVLPLKKEYVRALAAAGGKGHHVVCLVKSGEKVLSTQIASTVASSPKNPDLELSIPGQVKLDDIHSDFTIIFEVYCLRAQEEILPHEVKYHINKKGNNKMTPKKKQDSRLVRPPKESPAGPQAVRSPTFALHGYVVFSIQAINKTSWTLNKIPPISPLEGSVSMKIKCELDVSVEMKGFLNMFEDVSGLGAWHRRWCLLKGNVISYWKYPEDERKKPPIDTIDLNSCVTKTIGPVSRDICARLNTFLLERERPAEPNDRKTLTMECLTDKTVIKHLLSADSKEERIEWCSNLNKALSAMRMWGHKSNV